MESSSTVTLSAHFEWHKQEVNELVSGRLWSDRCSDYCLDACFPSATLIPEGQFETFNLPCKLSSKATAWTIRDASRMLLMSFILGLMGQLLLIFECAHLMPESFSVLRKLNQQTLIWFTPCAFVVPYMTEKKGERESWSFFGCASRPQVHTCCSSQLWNTIPFSFFKAFSFTSGIF